MLNKPCAGLNGILWILRTGALWSDLPELNPRVEPATGRFQGRRKEGVFDAVLLALTEDLRERGKLDLREAVIDGTFAQQKRAVPLAKQNLIRAPRDGSGTPRTKRSLRASRGEASPLMSGEVLLAADALRLLPKAA